LLPPQVVERQTVSVPSYADVLQQELARTIPAGTPTVTFNIGQNPINSEAEWVLKFPAPGTANSPTVVQVTGGGLNIPANVNLENYVITVELGDINLSSGVHVFNNVVLVTNNGNINLSDVQSRDLSALASGFINMNGGAKFSGSTLLATGNSWANINFNGATTNVEASNNLNVISQGNITYNAASDTRGSFLSVGDLSFNNNSTLYGSIGAKGSIYFNGSATVIFAESSTSPPPVPVANLVEETNFTVTSTIGLQIPATPSILSFKIDPQFDQQDPDSINDAFEVALVDALGNSLVHTIAKERDSFFNWTEGEEVTLGAGATYNANQRTVTLNLVGLTPGVAANLVFRLVNNDSDTTTSVRITDLVVTEAPVGTLPPVQGNLETAIPVVGATPDFKALTDVSDSFSAVYHRTSFNADTKLLSADMAVRNVGQYSVGVPLLVAVRNISDPSVTVRNPDGFMPDGIPYYNVSRLVADGKLNPNDVTQLRSLVFSNPQRVQFTYDLVVLAQLNRAPVINTQPNLELIGTQPYSYDVDATDPDGDALTYKLVVAPSGMTINPTSGLISWNPAAGARGNYAVMVEANDGRLGVATQQYTLSVIDAPPNRPPLIASTPVLDAAVNTPYTYQALAVDADSDALTFSLVAGPVGMSVNANTGAVTWWSPAASQLGTHNVTLRVADGRNGTAEQSFAILVGPQRGNGSPLIISTPVSALNVPVGFSSAVNSSYTYDVAALDPDEDTLTYSLVAAPAGMTINASTGVVSWSPAATDVGQHQVTVRVEDGRGGRDTQSFMLDAVATYPAQLRGTVFNDLNGDGQQFNSIGNADAPVTVTGTDGNSIALTNNTTRLEVFGGLVRNGLIPGGGYYNQTESSSQ
jgi:hypothetical protein